jgi:hypothetical protein
MSITEDDLKLIRASIIFSMSAINSSLREMDQWLAMNPAAPERNRVKAQVLELSSEFALLDARIEALNANTGNLAPPDQARIQRIINAANDVQADMKQQKTADLVLSIGTKALQIAQEAAAVGKNPLPA